jgi:hypothetical protein
MTRHQGQGPGRTPGEADTSPTLPLDAAAAPDPGTEPTVPLEAAGPPGAAEAGLQGAGSAPPARTDPEPSGYIGREREHTDVDEHGGVDLARLAWLGTVGACLIAVAILVVEGYFGYAAVTFAVAASAALNLT